MLFNLASKICPPLGYNITPATHNQYAGGIQGKGKFLKFVNKMLPFKLMLFNVVELET